MPDPALAITESRFNALKAKLRELFELDKSDLDFGIYRIMAAKNAEVTAFLDRPEASWENNRAEREIRPAVILRKNSQCNRSERGAATQAVLMSIHRTLKLRGLDPRQTITAALTAYAATGTLPPLP